MTTAILAVLITFHSLALGSTCFRLLHRLKLQKLWWDDFWAFIALLSNALLVVVFFALPVPVYLKKSIPIQNFARVSTLVAYTSTLWSSRLSVAVTIVRLLPKGNLRKVATAWSILFGLMWTALLIQKVFICGKPTANLLVKCPIPRRTGIMELTTDLVGDVWLIGGPVYMLWQMKLPRTHHRLILTIFTCGIFTTITSLVHTAYILRRDQVKIGISGHVQDAVSLIVCNLLVVVTYVFRIFWNAESPSESTSTSYSSNSRRPRRLTAHLHSSVPISQATLTDVTFSTLMSNNPISTLGDDGPVSSGGTASINSGSTFTTSANRDGGEVSSSPSASVPTAQVSSQPC